MEQEIKRLAQNVTLSKEGNPYRLDKVCKSKYYDWSLLDAEYQTVYIEVTGWAKVDIYKCRISAYAYAKHNNMKFTTAVGMFDGKLQLAVQRVYNNDERGKT